MKILSIVKLLSGEIKPETEVKINGWVRTRRDSKAGFSFLTINDGSSFNCLQIVIPNSLPNYQSEVLRLTAGCSVNVAGKLVQSPAKGQAFELAATAVNVLGWVDDPDTYPISPKHHTLEYLREHAHLRARTNVIGAVTRVRNCVSQAIHRFFHERGFCWIHTPIITSSDCEGAGELFRVSNLDLLNLPYTDNRKIDFSKDFFGKEVFLTVSGQLEVESYCLAMSKVYTFGPTFRAENSNTSRHLSEFWMIEPEVAFADLKDISQLAQEMLVYLCEAVLSECHDDMEFFAKRIDKLCIERIEKLISSEFKYVEYSDAIDYLKKAKVEFEFPVEWGFDLQSEHERYLTEKLFNAPIIVINYPKDIKGFYMRQNSDGKTVAAMDILAPGIGEIIGGSQREERIDCLDKRIDEMNLDKKGYNWYRDLRRYGSVPHAGFGLGLERFLGFVTGMGNVRDLIPFPRTPKHAEF